MKWEEWCQGCSACVGAATQAVKRKRLLTARLSIRQVARLLGKVTAVTHVAQLGSGGYRVLLPALSETQAVERVSAALRSAGGKDTVQIELAPLDTLLFVGNLGDMSDEGESQHSSRSPPIACSPGRGRRTKRPPQGFRRHNVFAGRELSQN